MPGQHLRRLAWSAAFAAGLAGFAIAQMAPERSVSPRGTPAVTAGPAPGAAGTIGQTPDATGTISNPAREPLEWGFAPGQRGFAPGETTGAGVEERNATGIPPAPYGTGPRNE
jgi:hypothetical protein